MAMISGKAPVTRSYTTTMHINTDCEAQMVLSSADMRRIGLSLVGFDFDRQAKAGVELNAERFTAHYGCSPIVCANIWADLLSQGDITRPTKGFFICLHFLKCYGI
jgi:hypothetical protein